MAVSDVGVRRDMDLSSFLVKVAESLFCSIGAGKLLRFFTIQVAPEVARA